MVDQYNFGGGDLGPSKESLHHPDGRPKTKKEIMEDIIAKSKMFKVSSISLRSPSCAARQLNTVCAPRQALAPAAQLQTHPCHNPLAYTAASSHPHPAHSHTPSPLLPQALKAKQRDEDEQYQEQLDQEFKDLVQGQALAQFFKAPGENK